TQRRTDPGEVRRHIAASGRDRMRGDPCPVSEASAEGLGRAAQAGARRCTPGVGPTCVGVMQFGVDQFGVGIWNFELQTWNSEHRTPNSELRILPDLPAVLHASTLDSLRPRGPEEAARPARAGLGSAGPDCV